MTVTVFSPQMMVTDVGDAMILRRLFEALLAKGVVVVFTSNRPPGDLYKGGLSWDYFAPFIRLVEDKLDVLPVGAGANPRPRHQMLTSAMSPSLATLSEGVD